MLGACLFLVESLVGNEDGCVGGVGGIICSVWGVFAAVLVCVLVEVCDEGVGFVCAVVGVFGSICSVVGVFGSVCSIVCEVRKISMVVGSVTLDVVGDVGDGCDEEKGNDISLKSTCLLMIVLCLVAASRQYPQMLVGKCLWNLSDLATSKRMVDEVAEGVGDNERRYRPSQRLPCKCCSFDPVSPFIRQTAELRITKGKYREPRHGTILDVDSRKPGTGRGVTLDAVMLRVFPITLTGEEKRWDDRLTPRTINTWDLLKKACIQRYNDLLYKCPTHDINSHQKVNIFYNGLSTMNRHLLNSHGPIPGITPAEGLTTIQTIADHSKKCHDGSPSQNIFSSNNSDGMAAIVSKLDNLGQDMKKLKENVHAIQVRCQLCDGPHLDKEYPLNEDTKSVKEEASLKNLGTQIEQLTKEVHVKAATEVPTSSIGKCKAVYDDVPITNASSNETNKIHGVSFTKMMIFRLKSESCEFNRLLAIDPDIFTCDIDIQESYKEIVYRCCVITLGEPGIEKTKNETERFGEEDDDTDEGWEDPEKCREEKIDAILDTVLDKLDDSCFSGTIEDEDNLDGITDYVEPTSYDGFIDSEDEAYKERCCNFARGNDVVQEALDGNSSLPPSFEV
ncbi:hypothetical protein Tco_0700794 [Tanacetum coccineum]